MSGRHLMANGVAESPESDSESQGDVSFAAWTSMNNAGRSDENR